VGLADFKSLSRNLARTAQKIELGRGIGHRPKCHDLRNLRCRDPQSMKQALDGIWNLTGARATIIYTHTIWGSGADLQAGMIMDKADSIGFRHSNEELREMTT